MQNHSQRPGRALRLAVLLSIVPLSACVSVATHRKLETERDALSASKRAMTEELRLTKAENERLESQLGSEAGKVSQMQGTYDALVAELKDELSSGKVQIEQLREGGVRVNLAQEILFSTGSAQLDDPGVDVLKRVSTELAKTPHRIEVEGHTDDRDIRGTLAKTYPTNWELAGARAARVVRLFEENGVKADRLVAASMGETKPVATNSSEKGRARNRRIEVRLLPDQAAALPASLAPGS
jgi:chemotaxis protein MotB